MAELKKGRYPESIALVSALMHAHGIDPNAEGAVADLARRTGIDGRYLYRWFSGEYRPNLSHALEMLERAGLLSLDAPRAQSSGPNVAAEQGVARNFEEIVRRNDAVLERLDRIEDALRDLAVQTRERRA